MHDRLRAEEMHQGHDRVGEQEHAHHESDQSDGSESAANAEQAKNDRKKGGDRNDNPGIGRRHYPTKDAEAQTGEAQEDKDHPRICHRQGVLR